MDHAEAGRVITRDAQVRLEAPGVAALDAVAGTAGGRPTVPHGTVVRPVARELAAAAGFLVAGIAATWPRITYLATGQVPGKSDEGQYVWGLWWMAHQVTHLENPWFTRAMAAPVGTYLGFHTLMPLPGLLMIPVTLAFGAVFSFNLLCVVAPGLVCYAMYRAARLWLPRRAGAIVAGRLACSDAMPTTGEVEALLNGRPPEDAHA